MSSSTFEDFQADAMTAGFDEVLERQWPPGTVLDAHSHSFGIEAVITQGEMWLTSQGSTLHRAVGSTFTLAPEMPHAERYGAEGATFWVARRRPR